jgi:hypothetical protein
MTTIHTLLFRSTLAAISLTGMTLAASAKDTTLTFVSYVGNSGAPRLRLSKSHTQRRLAFNLKMIHLQMSPNCARWSKQVPAFGM